MSAVADEIWAILKENSWQIGVLRESHKEFKEQFEAAQKETDRILKDLQATQKETSREIKALVV